MTKIYKVSFYATDINDEYYNNEHFLSHLKEQLWNLDAPIDFLKIEESKEFEWDDDLKINKINATVEDFEKYFD